MPDSINKLLMVAAWGAAVMHHTSNMDADNMSLFRRINWVQTDNLDKNTCENTHCYVLMSGTMLQ